MDLSKSKRIMLVGSGGSGKSTLARRLGHITNIPVIHLDNEFWQPNWVATPRDRWIEKQKCLISGEKWILDGNYGGTMKMRFEAADTVIFLDINRWVCIYSAIKRWILNYGKTRLDMAKGCPEKIDFEFIKWIYSFPKTSNTTIVSLMEIYKDKNIVILKSRKEMRKFLDEMSI